MSVPNPSLSPQDDFSFCVESLDRVSRTFSLNIKVLRGTAYRGVLLAYLLCRIADTIEDEHSLPAAFKIKKLRQYSDLFPPAPAYATQVKSFLTDVSFTEKTHTSVLLANTVRVFNELVKLPAATVAVISDHVKEMALGMASFQERGDGRGVVFLEDQEDLERYCYYVAGTVGLMLTSIFSHNSDKISPRIRGSLESRSVAFGLGLQITNIAKDFFADRSRGWCYVPRSFFSDEGIDPVSDIWTEKPEAFSRVQARIIALALGYLDEALLYTLDIPRRLFRYRLFCLWPLFMAVETLAKLQTERVSGAEKTVKITRRDVERIVRDTSLSVLSNSALKSLYNRIRPATA